MRIEYIDVPLYQVMKAYADGFCAKREGESIYTVEWFVDPVKEQVIFRMFLNEKEVVEKK